jgi:type II secretory pathway component PulM
MKFNREEIQKIFLGGLLLLGVVYSYFDLLLFPLQKRQAAARKSIEALAPEVKKAEAQIKRTEELQKSAPEKTAVIAQVNAMIPEGSPVAWFPPKVTDFFKRQGIEKVNSKYHSEAPEKELAGYRRLSWGLDLQKVEFAQFGTALCALENEEPLLEVTSLQIDTNRDDVENQRATLTVQNIVKQ